MKNVHKVVSVATALVLAAGLGVATAQSASARSITPYCMSHIFGGGDGIPAPSTSMWCRVQEGPASEYGYVGPVDGVMGRNSWRGVQNWLNKEHFGYYGPIDGIPGTNTYKAMQRFAKLSGGYTGLINGVMDTNSWNCFNYGLRVAFFGL